LAFNKTIETDPDLAVAVAAITILTEVIKVSKGTAAPTAPTAAQIDPLDAHASSFAVRRSAHHA